MTFENFLAIIGIIIAYLTLRHQIKQNEDKFNNFIILQNSEIKLLNSEIKQLKIDIITINDTLVLHKQYFSQVNQNFSYGNQYNYNFSVTNNQYDEKRVKKEFNKGDKNGY